MPAGDEQQQNDPAGSHPAHDAGDLLPADTAEHDEDGDELELRAARPPRGARFHFLTGVSVAVALGALFLLGAFLLGQRDGEQRAPSDRKWSQWGPTRDGAAGAKQIAARVGSAYRLSHGAQLVRVEGGEMEVAGLPLTVAVRQSGGATELFDGDGVLYRLCGPGKSCAISSGKPSQLRHLLLRREALELALYSFRYLEGIDQVVVLLPPKPGDEAAQALFFRRDQMRDTLVKPLDATLVGRTPTVGGVLRSPDTLLVEQFTIPALFRFNLTLAGKDDRALLVLEPFNSPGLDRQDPSRTQTTQLTRQSGDSRGAGASLGS